MSLRKLVQRESDKTNCPGSTVTNEHGFGGWKGWGGGGIEGGRKGWWLGGKVTEMGIYQKGSNLIDEFSIR